MRAFRILAVAAVTATTASVANALPITTDWTYNLSSVWTSATFGTATPSGPPSFVCDPGFFCSATPTLLKWGDPFPPGVLQSSLEIFNPAANSPIKTCIVGDPGCPTGAELPAAGSTLIHSNWPQKGSSSDSWLTAMSLQSTLTLLAAAPPAAVGSPPGLPQLNFNILFRETPNSTPCAATSPADNPCNDIFALDGNPFFNQTFAYLGETYFVNIFPIAGGSLGVLENDACAAVGKGPGCVGFTTEEGKQTQLDFAFTISTRPLGVPEPGILALFALGLVGLGFTVSRRNA